MNSLSPLDLQKRCLLRLPLLLTMSRLLISPIFIALYLQYWKWGISLRVLPFLLLFFFLLAEFSDFLDGYLARKFHLVTELGKILDPVVDSVARLTMLMAFTRGFVHAPLFPIVIFIYRDAMVGVLRMVCAMRGMALEARKSGKIKAVVQAVSIFLILLLMIPYAWGILPLAKLRDFAFYLVYAPSLYALLSGGEYIYIHRAYIKKVIWQKNAL